MNDKLMIVAPVQVKMNAISNALIGAFENGYSPWIGLVRPLLNLPTGHKWYSEEDSLTLVGWGFEIDYDDEDSDEGEFDKTKTINIEDVKNGLTLMANGSPKHFADLISENDDAITHDVLLQYIVLGNIIFG